MAKTKSVYGDRLKNVKAAHEKVYKKSTDSSSIPYKIGNYEKRLSSVGIDTKEATDKRNWFEKLTNLPEDQNALFDAFELIGRPQQALFGAIEAAQKGDNILEGAKQGFTGEDYVYGGDLLRNLGVNDDKLFSFFGNDISAADLGGLALDIFADPVDLIPAGGLVKAGKVAGATSDVNKAAKALDIAKAANDASRIQEATRALDLANDALKTVKDTKYSASLLEAGMQGAVGGTKRLLNKGLTKGAEALDVKTIGKLAKNAGLIEDGTKVTSDMLPTLTKQLTDLGIDFTSKSDALKAAKKAFSRTADYGASMPGNIYDNVIRGNNINDFQQSLGTKYLDDAKKVAQKYADDTGKSIEEVARDAQIYIQSKYKTTTDASYMLRDALSKKGGKSLTIKGTDKELKGFMDSFDAFKNKYNLTDDIIKLEKAKDGVKLVGSKKYLGIIHNNTDMMNDLSNIVYKAPNKIGDIAQKEVDRVSKLYNKNDGAFKNVVDEIEKVIPSYSGQLDKLNKNMTNISEIGKMEGYTPGTISADGELYDKAKKNITGKSDDIFSDDFYRGASNAFGNKQNNPLAIQANIDFENKRLRELDDINNAIEKISNNTFSSKIKAKEEEIGALKIKKDEMISNFNKNIAKANLSELEASNLKKMYNKNFDEIDDIITKEVKNKASKVTNKTVLSNLAQKGETYVNKSNKVIELRTKLANGDLTEAQAKKLTSRLQKALNSQNKSKANLQIAVEKLKGSAEESFIKNADKIATKMADRKANLAIKSEKAQQLVDKSLDRIKSLNSRFNYMSNRIDNSIAKKELELKDLLSKGKDIANTNQAKELQELQKLKELNESMAGKKLYTENIFENIEDFINKSTKEAKDLNAYNELFLKQGLYDNSLVRFVGKGESVPKSELSNMQKLNNDDIKQIMNFLNKNQDLLGNKDAFKYFKGNFRNSKSLYVDKDALSLIKLTNSFNPKDTNLFLDSIDKANNLFKKTSTVTLGTQLRNLIGNMFNMKMTKIDNIDMMKAYKDAARLKKSDYILELLGKNYDSLSKAQKFDYDVITQFIESGAMGSGKDLRDIGNLIEQAKKGNADKNLLKKAWDKVFSVSGELNQATDNFNRLALLSHATRNPKYVKSLGVKDPIEAMHHVLFNPQNLSPFEKKYLKRIIPFYTFTKQNLMFQMKNIVNNTSQYNRLFKLTNKTYDAIGKDNYRQYQKENFEIPIFNGDNGLVTFKSNLPVSDLGEYLSNPIQRLVSSATPLLKAPVEYTTGVDLFTGQDISDQSPIDALIKGAGLTNASKTVKGIGSVISGESESIPASLMPSVFRYTDPEKIASQRQYEEMLALQEYIKQLKNQGIDVPTIAELNRQANSSLRSVQKRRDAYNKRRSQ